MFKKLLESIRLGNQYRLEKYGRPDTFGESARKSRAIYRKYREEQIPKTLSMFASSKEMQENEAVKQKYSYWQMWTGARFVTEQNPNGGNGETARCNPVTGYWGPLK